MVESSLVYHVSPSLDEVFNNDVRWVIPGLSAWSWFSQETGTPGMQMEYLDSASEFGWRYSIVDANWDMWTNDEEEIQKLVSHGAALYPPVGVWLWYNSGGSHNVVEERPRDRMLDAQIRRKEFHKISSWGVKGVKVTNLPFTAPTPLTLPSLLLISLLCVVFRWISGGPISRIECNSISTC